MDSLTIDRGSLLTGTALQTLAAASVIPGGRLLEPKSGLMCCLGVYCAAEGYADVELAGEGMPSALSYWGPQDWLKQQVTADEARVVQRGQGVALRVEDAIAQTNDDPRLHPSRREARIAKLFKKYGGIDVSFTGSYRASTRKARAAAASR